MTEDRQKRYGSVCTGLVFALWVGLFAGNAFAQSQPDGTATAPLKPGTVFQDCPNCPELVVVPAGLFIMGSNGSRKTENPAHRVNITRPFAIGRFEVTFREWYACLKAKACSHAPDDHKWGRRGRPVINVTWDQAETYTSWLTEVTGHRYRLPSEAEWEYAHRAGTTTAFWWGEKAGENNANCKDCKTQWSAKSSAPVGSFKPNPFGLHDTTGNVFEWVADCWNPNHQGAPSTTEPRKDGDCKNRVIRGGSFYYFNKVAQASYRAKNPPGVKSYWLGFRVVREIP
ncbi:MAG: SUMF1/EgtB/PvdO family nonheme iron enzyme [Rhodospirillales bacterium]|nr:SUMF1/EgtB/PvdO family nonheme iron enzyme [Rhodospirillales bacterium]